MRGCLDVKIYPFEPNGTGNYLSEDNVIFPIRHLCFANVRMFDSQLLNTDGGFDSSVGVSFVLNRFYNKILDRDWFSALLFVT